MRKKELNLYLHLIYRFLHLVKIFEILAAYWYTFLRLLQISVLSEDVLRMQVSAFQNFGVQSKPIMFFRDMH